MKRLTLLDNLRLRRSSVYRNPKEVSFLSVVYGDFSDVFIPCTPIDKEGRIHHISDFPMQMISRVNVDDKPVSWGYKTCTAWQDETGRSIACVVFDSPQSGKVSVSGKGTIKSEDGSLIENPADFIQHLFFEIQGYDGSSIDASEISNFYTECLREEIRIAVFLSSDRSLKSILDELALNVHAHCLISDGKSAMKLRGRPSDAPVRYRFEDDGSDSMELEITSEDIVNEVTVNFAYDPAAGRYRSSITKHNPESKLLYGEFSKTIDLSMVQRTRQAEKIADAFLKTYSVPQIISSLKHDLRSLYVEAGDRVSITHAEGVGENGFVAAEGIVTKRTLAGSETGYTVAMENTASTSELVALTQTAGGGRLGAKISYSSGVLTILVYDDLQGYPPIQGAAVTISGIKKMTGRSGEAYFEIPQGTYKALISATGHADEEMIFSI